MEFWASITLTIFSLCLPSSSADDVELSLVNRLLKNYDKRVRPSLNSSEAINVTFGVALAQIIDVDERNQILTTNCWLNQVWLDVNLRWDPDKYNGIKVVRIPFTDVWKPDILLYNNADVTSYFSSLSSNVIVTSEGNVTWLSMVIFKSSCRIDVRYFPFDEQNCSMQFASWTYDGFQLQLRMNSEEGDISNYIRNSEWVLIKLHVEWNLVYYSCCIEPYPDITYYIQIRRRPLFYVFNMILPCILITLVALLGFYIPSDSGEKVTMGITTLLSMTVFMMLVAENMPPTSDVLPLIGIYYGITISIVSFATAMTVFTLNIHHKGARGHEVPIIIKKICFGILAKIFCMRLEKPNNKSSNVAHLSDMSSSSEIPEMEMNPTLSQQQSMIRETRFHGDLETSNGGILSPRFSRLRGLQSRLTSPTHSSDDFERQFKRVLTKVYQTIERNEIRLAEQDRRDVIKLEWQQVAQIVDRLFLTIFVCVTILITCIVMFKAPHSTESLIS
ncbi:neuronal acetylcholine receptor subunit alpha-10 isoform X3 [Octopus bimaculoides]|uniref:Neuronal acetylcholine receptor subunit alpha-10-like isoform X3 n=1 Tax=Octopus sinensis TaxID=2607531 RepID=A0A7E6EQC0_9MOLL|nr:neuronal acetylcholine receptor subunit alpha-10 isoform X3 [Octopus bimaculoides]XP_036357544.1 neuronal acetylcholine receptor subunit alpha-10-like isoform X3 [Octopus sinensis]|eukprot:XP_014786892.1 PREDICTED: neuronal acetylcholine receptor subunit alpha-10-like isoform X3 [Octopus bimaculoides]